MTMAGDPTQFELPFGGSPRMPALCRVVLAQSGRRFGSFQEKTLECNRAARRAIDVLCRSGGFTQSWESTGRGDVDIMVKIPVIILVKIVLGLPPDAEQTVLSLRGAYPISMSPMSRTCMNVIVGRHKSISGEYVLDKFSLYWPDNAEAAERWGNTWPLLQGYSFRTAVLNGTLNRSDLRGLAEGRIPSLANDNFNAKVHGLIIDDASIFEDCAYFGFVAGETDEERTARIENMVKAMEAAYSGTTLALSYDPEESLSGSTALRSEWELLKKHAQKKTLDASIPASSFNESWTSHDLAEAVCEGLVQDGMVRLKNGRRRKDRIAFLVHLFDSFELDGAKMSRLNTSTLEASWCAHASGEKREFGALAVLNRMLPKKVTEVNDNVYVANVEE